MNLSFVGANNPMWRPGVHKVGVVGEMVTGINMPILSVRRVAKKGSKVEFWDNWGVIRLPNGKETTFYEYTRVYLVNFLVKPPDDANISPFTGPGN